MKRLRRLVPGWENWRTAVAGFTTILDISVRQRAFYGLVLPRPPPIV